MEKYSFDFSDIDKLRNYFRSQLEPDGVTDRIYFPPEIAEGYLSYYKISPEVFLFINNYKAHVDIEYVREPIDENDIILHFRKYALNHQVKKNEIVSSYSDSYTPGNMRCMDAQQGERVYITKGAEVKSTMIVLKSSYTKPYFMKNSLMAEKVDSYIRHSHQDINKFYLSYKQSILFDQIVTPNFSKVENYLYFIARGIRLLETFWRDVLKWETESNPFNINSSQVGNIYKVSTYLEHNLHEPFIGVDQLSSMAHMSRTNFFNMFKEIHDQTPLEFFNNKKLESSYNMIFTEGLSIKEVMGNLNYSNSSKFRKAFFNKFDVYPDIRI
ncbi:helix-turn-helix domain-containing protein [Aquimarina sp. 2201CG14-23]|uniref:helix-turn-helix domain-containing protein n=1 Tax=Aquimarina mycalae TaxID=3040073 RepID=UPI002477CF38|nr:AraC family transcriptional regulator [Aquimarina sp. 2201CG14-23]MDH7444924.1 AraC family transcriptional regulator [Aquimarina sp. 2201CG14-23]